MCKRAAYGINLLENGGLFYKIQPKMCSVVVIIRAITLFSFIHSFRICWRMSVSAAAGLTWGRSGGANSSCIQITRCISWCSCTRPTARPTTLPHRASGLKTSTLARWWWHSEILKQSNRNASHPNRLLSSGLRPSSRKLHLKEKKKSTYHINTAQSSPVLHFQAEIFPTK